jgi:hypothetical protein
MEGNFIAIQDEEIVKQSLEQWAEGFRASSTPDLTSATEFPPGTPDVVKAFDMLLRRYNSWADALNASATDLIAEGQLWDETKALFSDLDDMTTRLRNLSECEQLMLGDLGDKFGNLLTRAMFAVVVRASTRPDLTATQLQTLVVAALRAGALGGGSLFPAEAAAADKALQLLAEDILSRYVVAGDPDCAPNPGCLLATPEAMRVVTTAAQMRWELRVDGFLIKADWLLSQYGISLENSDYIPLNPPNA